MAPFKFFRGRRLDLNAHVSHVCAGAEVEATRRPATSYMKERPPRVIPDGPSLFTRTRQQAHLYFVTLNGVSDVFDWLVPTTVTVAVYVPAFMLGETASVHVTVAPPAGIVRVLR